MWALLPGELGSGLGDAAVPMACPPWPAQVLRGSKEVSVTGGEEPVGGREPGRQMGGCR